MQITSENIYEVGLEGAIMEQLERALRATVKCEGLGVERYEDEGERMPYKVFLDIETGEVWGQAVVNGDERYESPTILEVTTQRPWHLEDINENFDREKAEALPLEAPGGCTPREDYIKSEVEGWIENQGATREAVDAILDQLREDLLEMGV